MAKALQALGVSVGDSFLDPNEWNPTGYFEHPDIVRLNDQLLGLVGKRWDSLALPPWQEWEALTTPYQAEALEILERDFGQEVVFGIKDPRATRLLPFWLSTFKRAGVKPYHVVALRNPMSVARSLAARDGFTPEKSYLLWVQHMFAAVRDTEGKPRVVVDYDALIAEPRAQLERIAAMLDMPRTDESRGAITAYADSFLSHSLRRSVHDPKAVRGDPRAGELVGKAYDLLRRLSQDRVTPLEDTPTFKRQWRALGNLLEDTASIFRYLDARENQIEALAAGMEAKVLAAVNSQATDSPTALLSTTDQVARESSLVEAQARILPAARPLKARRKEKGSDLRVSVVIPLYNHERFIEAAMESIFAQTVRPAEIIIIDDGSTDGSVERVRHLCKDRPEVIFWSWPNQGAHHTLNAAIHRATGDFVAVLNSDDRYDPDRLAACLAVMQSHPTVDVVFTEVSFIDENGQGVESRWYEEALAFYKASGDLALALCHANFLMTTSNLFIRRAAFDSVGYFSSLRYAHDLEFFLRLILAGKSIHFLERRLLEYRFHSKNTIAENRAGTDVERAAVLAFFLHRRGLADGTREERDARLQRYVGVLEQQGITEMVEYCFALLEREQGKERLAGQESAAEELRRVLSRLGMGSASPESDNSLFTQFVAARNRLLRTADAVSTALSEHATEVDRLHGVLADKDQGLQKQEAEIRRLNDALVARDAALTAPAFMIAQLNDVLVTKDQGLAEQAAEIRRLHGVVVAKDSAVAEQAAEIQRLNDVLEAKDSAVAEQAAEIQRLNDVMLAKDSALAEQAAEIRRMNDFLVAKKAALAEQAAVIRRMNEVVVEKDRALAQGVTEIQRMSDALVAKDRTLTQHVTEIRRLRDAVEEQERVAADHGKRIHHLMTEMDEQRRALTKSMNKTDVLEAALADRERELAAWRQTSWYKLGQAWDQQGWSVNKIGKVTYHLMRGVTPETLKQPVRPLVGRLKRRMQGRGPAAMPVPQLVKPDDDARARRPRALHVIANFMLGGSSRLVVDLIEGLGNTYEQKVVTSFLPSPAAYHGIDVVEFRSPQSPEDVLPFLLEYRPSLVHVHYWGDCDFWWYDIFFRAIKTLGCRVIENVNTPVYPYQADFVDRYVYVSSYVRSTFGEENGSRNLTIYPGSDFGLFSRRGNRQLPADCLGMVYRLENDKLNEQSIDVFIKVVQRRPQTNVIIVGGGTFLEPYRRAARDAGVESNFVFTGYVDYSKLPELYEQMTIFVAPVWKESFGQVSSFAMSMGIPITGYNVGGLAEIVDDVSLLAKAGDSDELATLVIQLLDDPERCRRIGVRSRERALALFSVEAMLDAYRNVYGELLGVPG